MMVNEKNTYIPVQQPELGAKKPCLGGQGAGEQRDDELGHHSVPAGHRESYGSVKPQGATLSLQVDFHSHCDHLTTHSCNHERDLKQSGTKYHDGILSLVCNSISTTYTRTRKEIMKKKIPANIPTFWNDLTKCIQYFLPSFLCDAVPPHCPLLFYR